MGDNVYLGDRNGVRTPMQWTADRNGGFSRADPARLYAPLIMDSVYGYQSVNVEAQERSPHLAAQLDAPAHRACGSGTSRRSAAGRSSCSVPENRRIFAFIRRLDAEDPILVVANLSRTMQAASLDLSTYAGLVPIEMSGGTDLPRIGDAPYFLTLGPYAFYWLRLQAPGAGAGDGPAARRPRPSRGRMRCRCCWARTGRARSPEARGPCSSAATLRRFFSRQRWFQKRGAAIADARIGDWSTLRGGKEPVMATTLVVRFEDGREDRYFMPLAMASCTHADEIVQQSPDGMVARIAGATKGILHGSLDADVARELFSVIGETRSAEMRHGQLQGSRLAVFDEIRTQATDGDVTPVTPSVERANSAIRFGERFVLKLARRLWPGPNHEVEMGRFLTDRAHFPRAPRLAGTNRVTPTSGETTTLAILHAFVPHQMDGWRQALSELERYFESAIAWDVSETQGDRSPALSAADVPEAARRTVGSALEAASTLDRRTAELHLTLAGDEAISEFGTATLDVEWTGTLVSRTQRQTDSTLARSARPPNVRQPERQP